MRHLLGREGGEALARLASSRALLAFDFDGTLAPIVAGRDDARMRAHTAALLRELCRRYPCAVISGRARADVRRRLEGAGVREVIGSHGVEPGPNLRAYARVMAQARRSLGAALAQEPGVDLEDKRYSLALHYRRASSRRTARASIVRAVAALPAGLRMVPGKLVVNLVPESASNKGQSLLRLRARSRAEVVLYVGDDVTDEDVFELAQSPWLVSARVGRSRVSAASYFLRDQGEIDSLLARLVELRPRVRRPRGSGARGARERA